MKSLIFSLGLVALTVNLMGQVIIYTTNTEETNVGFGKNADAQNNEFMQFAVNGPIFGDDKMPVGGYIDNGKMKKGWVEPSEAGGNFSIRNAIFGVGTDGNVHLVPYAELHLLPEMKWCIQNGPVLVQNGENVCGTSQSEYPRSGVGATEDGRIMVIISLTPLTFREFGKLFVKEGCIKALYLDGGPPVGYADKTGKYGFDPDATKIQFFLKN